MLVFFVFTTVMAYYFYIESGILYLFHRSRYADSALETASIWTLRFLLLGATVFGAVKEADTIWMLGDIGVGVMAWINVIALLVLCPQGIKALRDYERQLKEGRKHPSFHASEFGIDSGCWPENENPEQQ